MYMHVELHYQKSVAKHIELVTEGLLRNYY